jgi:hypothetical protein
MNSDTHITSLYDLRNYFCVYGDSPTSLISKYIYKFTDCGAWIQIMDKDGNWVTGADLDNIKEPILKVRIGSIVEGSDVEIGPYDLDIPCTIDDLNAVIEEVEIQAEEEWQVANE